MKWSAPASIDSVGLTSVSCVSGPRCTAVDGTGAALIYSGGAWTAPASVDTAGSPKSVSCASATFCAAVDASGNALTYNGTEWAKPVAADKVAGLSSVLVSRARSASRWTPRATRCTSAAARGSRPHPARNSVPKPTFAGRRSPRRQQGLWSTSRGRGRTPVHARHEQRADRATRQARSRRQRSRPRPTRTSRPPALTGRGSSSPTTSASRPIDRLTSGEGSRPLRLRNPRNRRPERMQAHRPHGRSEPRAERQRTGSDSWYQRRRHNHLLRR